MQVAIANIISISCADRVVDVNTIKYSNFKLCSTRPVCIIKFEFFGCCNQFFLIKFDFCESFVVVVVVVIFVFSTTVTTDRSIS